MGDPLLEEKLQQVLGRKECPQRLQETVSQCIRITREQQALRGEERTGFWQYLSDVFRFEGIGILGLHTAILLFVCAVLRVTVDILLLPAFMPLFALAMMPVLLRSRYYGVSEIEAVTRASGAQIILAKLILSGAAGLVCITAVLSLSIAMQETDNNTGQLVLYCLVPYLVCMIALLRIVRLSAMGRTRACVAVLTGCCVCWGIFVCSKGIPKSIAQNRVQKLLEVVGLASVSGRKLKTFSGGMKQRVGIAQALLNEPKILILDEPTAGLDPKERVRFRNLLADYAGDKIVILSTHIVSDIEAIADRVLVMKQGKFILQGTIPELTGKVDKKVWELAVRPEEARMWQNQAVVANLRHEGDDVVLRILADTRPDERAVPCGASLEDLYLYYFGAEEGVQ